jgi:4-hydroxy-3-methylbut-2-enyl diphosphate reductase
LIHISKISLEKIAKPDEVLTIGQVVTVKITDIDDENRKLSLSIRALLEEEKRAAEKAERDAQRAERDAQRKAEAEEQAKLDAEMAPYIVRSI